MAPDGADAHCFSAAPGLFLFIGHFFIFMAYRIGPTHRVAPFFYSFSSGR